MKNYIILFGVLVLSACSGGGDAPVDNTITAEVPAALPRANAEAHGLASSAILNFLEKVDSSGIEFHSIMLVRDDSVIAEGWWAPYQSDYRHTLYSLSKSFTSTAIGFAVQEGLLSVNDKVISFFPDDLPDTVDTRLADMEIYDLLTMTTGHESGTMPGMFADPDGNWPRGFLAQALTYEPGAQFMYNTGATYMLSAILQKVSGQTALEFLTPRLIEPLGLSEMDWETDPKGVNVGGYGLRATTEDISKLGLLYLHNGRYNGKQLLDSAWVATATSGVVESYPGDGDWSQGYGYQFWQCVPDNMFRGDGAFGQFCIVAPDLDLVIAVTSESKDMQASMNLIWDYLIPEFSDAPLDYNESAEQSLDNALMALTLSRDSLGDMMTQPIVESFAFSENDLGLSTIALNLPLNEFTLYGEDTLNLSFGWNSWELNDVRRSLPLGADVDSHMAIRGGWNANGDFVLERQFVETAHHDRFTFDFSGGTPVITWNESVSLWTEGNVGRSLVLQSNSQVVK